jgi:hypothetical protein
MDFITKEVIDKTMELLNRHLRRNQGAIERAYCNTDEALAVALKIKYIPKPNSTEVKTEINFVTDRVKDSNGATIEQNEQLELFDGQGQENVVPIRPQKISGSTAGQKCRQRWYR